jgi:hypothetical protein
MLTQNGRDRRARDAMPEILQRTLDPGVAPAPKMWSFTFSALCEAGDYVEIGALVAACR